MEDPKAFPAKTSFRCFVEHEMTGWPNENKKWLSCFVDDEQLPANQDNPGTSHQYIRDNIVSDKKLLKNG